MIPAWSFHTPVIAIDSTDRLLPPLQFLKEAALHLWDLGEAYAVLTFATALRDDFEVRIVQERATPGRSLAEDSTKAPLYRIFESRELGRWLKRPRPDGRRNVEEIVLQLEAFHSQILVLQYTIGHPPSNLRSSQHRLFHRAFRSPLADRRTFRSPLTRLEHRLKRMGGNAEYLRLHLQLLQVWQRVTSRKPVKMETIESLLDGFSAIGSELGILYTVTHLIYPMFEPSLIGTEQDLFTAGCPRHFTLPGVKRVSALARPVARHISSKRRLTLLTDRSATGRGARASLSPCYAAAFESCGLQMSKWSWDVKTTLILTRRPFLDGTDDAFVTRCMISSLYESVFFKSIASYQSRESVRLDVWAKRLLAATLEISHDFSRALETCEAALRLAQQHRSVIATQDMGEILMEMLQTCQRWVDIEASGYRCKEIVARAQKVLNEGILLEEETNSFADLPDLRAAFSIIVFISSMNGFSIEETERVARAQLDIAQQSGPSLPIVLRAKGYLLELEGNYADAVNVASKAYTLLGQSTTLEQADHLVRQSMRALQLKGTNGGINDDYYQKDAQVGLYESYTMYGSVGRFLDAVGSLCRLAEAHANLGEDERSLQVLHLMQKTYEDFRLEAYGLPEYETSEFHHSLVGNKLTTQALSTAVRLCLRTGSEDAWLWSQRSKAQALSSLLDYDISANPSVPQRLFDDMGTYAMMTGSWVYSDREQADLLEMKNLVDVIRSREVMPDLQRTSFKHGFLQLAERFKRYTRLAGVLPMIVGGPASPEDLRWMSMLPGVDVAFVEWIRCGDELWVSVLQFDATNLVEPFGPRQFVVVEVGYDSDDIENEGKLRVHTSRLEITPQELTELQRRLKSSSACPANTDDQDEDEELEDVTTSIIAEMRSLIGPVLRHTKPGTLLVLSPTTPMEGIPLHTIPIGDDEDSSSGQQILLDRNPVVFCPSYTVIRQCVSRYWQDVNLLRDLTLQQELEGKPREPASLICVLPRDSDRSRVQGLFDAITRLLVGNTVTTVTSAASGSDFGKLIEKSPIINYLGHASYTNEDTDSDPSFSPSMTTPSDQALLLGSAGGRLTSSSILKQLRLVNAPLVNLLACNSLRVHNVVGQEPVGIMPSFLLAGACSVIGTLWKTDMDYAIKFAELFYQFALDMLQPIKVGNSWCPVLDVAEALRKAVLALRTVRLPGKGIPGNGPVPIYYWAPFILSGSWLRQWPLRGGQVDELLRRAKVQEEKETEENEREERERARA